MFHKEELSDEKVVKYLGWVDLDSSLVARSIRYATESLSSMYGYLSACMDGSSPPFSI